MFAFAHDLGTISAASDPVLFTVGHIRDPAIEYIISGGALQDRSLYFWSQYPSAADLVSVKLGTWSSWDNADRGVQKISDFIDDYSDALNRSQAFDSRVSSDASAISTDYAGIVAASIRQAFGATEITISKVWISSFYLFKSRFLIEKCAFRTPMVPSTRLTFLCS